MGSCRLPSPWTVNPQRANAASTLPSLPPGNQEAMEILGQATWRPLTTREPAFLSPPGRDPMWAGVSGYLCFQCSICVHPHLESCSQVILLLCQEKTGCVSCPLPPRMPPDSLRGRPRV